MREGIRWGILGTGSIAKKFAEGLRYARGAKLVAVGSRKRESAEAFGEAFHVPNRHPSYEELAADPDVDVIYVATPHTLHKENTILCLDAGKAVLCEKPFAINASQAETMVERARKQGLFLMEAMWTRYLPVMGKLRQLLQDRTIGEVRMLMADFGFRASFNPEGRLLNPALGGGGLLDVGVYPVSFASMVFGPPARILSMAHLGETGVDEQAAILLGYSGGQIGILACGVRTTTPQEAVVLGTEGRIRLHASWWRGEALTLSRTGKEDQRFDLPLVGNGYNYEAEEVMNCLRAGKRESDLMPLDESIVIMRTLDQIREPWGLRYPME